ncbi:hypothetical protein P7D15_01425 [Bacillus cereus]|uniref:hypothetical protein n=1 Tax=Bacillus cereus group TaxID=86661 RepID=UPI002406BA3B|nr:hypothetical protein [Bacillus cereus]MCU5281462.1 hypothetical protein [Bacillus cereus]MDF9599075.1 hypothetical protein [Bacillus cereus]MDG1589408.1 hypothetical protein [Bacillus cereus]HDR7922299.1 hypothetical protein [Bacillus paranthracis]
MISIWVCPIAMEKYTFGAEITGTSVMINENKINLLIPLREVVETEEQEDYYLITVSGE